MNGSEALSGLASIPYCGLPPVPAQLLSRWNLDPVLIAALLLIAVGYAAWPIAAPAPARWRRVCFFAGWSVAAFATVSPLCPLSVALFSARVAQHMLLAVVAAPLLALGAPLRAVHGGRAWTAALAFAGVLWFWHAPAPYDATFNGAAVYWAMEISLLASAWWLAAEVSAQKSPRLVDILAASAITSVQMGVLGAVLTFAPRAIYSVHALTTGAWGLTQLEDQQLGGVIMWVPAGVVVVAAVVASLAIAMRRSDGAAAPRLQM